MSARHRLTTDRRLSGAPVGQRCRTVVGLLVATLGLAACVASPDQRLAQAGPGFSNTALSANDIRVVDWNIKKAQVDAWGGARGRAIVARLLRDADLVTLQEVCAPVSGGTVSQRLAAAQLTGVFAASFSAAILGCGSGRATGVLTGSRVAPIRRIALVSQHREFGLTPKASLATTYPIAGHAPRLLVINAHLLNFEWLTLDDYADQLAAIGALLEQHAGPIILAGDMNSRSPARTRLLEKTVHQAGLKAVFDGTDDARTRAVIGGDQPLDHIYYRGLSIITPGRIGAEALTDVSDHNSLSVRFAYP